ncbi:MAG TPA: arsenite methyltransferase [Dehalococcoidia bacterium]|nr:arsenite methyltransferase [Dehalococcoidia bacterium]
MNEEQTRKVVREGYARIAREANPCCAPKNSCCSKAEPAYEIGRHIGYTDEELGEVPEGANLGLGCGNPVALASLKEGETVLDLGSGAGFDCFLAAGRVGEKGRVIGVDMTPEMLEKARENAGKGSYTNIEFRLGEIENLPVADNHVDVVISNCVINLSPDKKRVFAESFRVLKPGGRLMVSDIVLLKELPDSVKSSVQAYVGCLAGAIMKDDYIGAIRDSGFAEVTVVDETCFPVQLMADDPAAGAAIDKLSHSTDRGEGVTDSVVSLKVHAVKPNTAA